MIQNSINQMLATFAIGAKLAGYNRLEEEKELKGLGNKSSAIDEMVRRYAENPDAEDYEQRVKEYEKQQEAIELRQAELGGANIQGINEGREGIEYAKSRIPKPAQQMQSNVDPNKRKEALLKASEEARGMSEQANEVSKLIERTKLGS